MPTFGGALSAPKLLTPERVHDLARSALYGAMGYLGITVLTDEAVDSVASRISAALAAHDQKVREDATLAEHQSHIEFESELYATLVDPVAEGSIKEAEMRKQLLEQARWYRQRVNDLTNFTALLKAADDGLKTWAARHPKWWKRIDHTPIPNDLLVNVVQAICAASRAEEKEIEDRYASYANHCAIQKKVPLSFHSWRKL